MNNTTTARLPLRLTETVGVLTQVILGQIVRDTPNGQYRSVPALVVELNNSTPATKEDINKMFGWCAIGESLKHTFKVKQVDDTYTVGVHVVPRKGLLVTLRECETKKEVYFYMAGHEDMERVSDHMCSLTDDLLEQWFKDRTKKTKEDRDREKAEKKAKRETEEAEHALIGAKVAAHFDTSIKKVKKQQKPRPA